LRIYVVPYNLVILVNELAHELAIQCKQFGGGKFGYQYFKEFAVRYENNNWKERLMILRDKCRWLSIS